MPHLCGSDQVWKLPEASAVYLMSVVVYAQTIGLVFIRNPRPNLSNNFVLKINKTLIIKKAMDLKPISHFPKLQWALSDIL